MNKQEQKKLLIEVMQADEKDGLYEYSANIILDELKKKRKDLEKEVQELDCLKKLIEIVKNK